MEFKDDGRKKVNEETYAYTKAEIDKLFAKLFAIVGIDILLFVVVGIISR